MGIKDFFKIKLKDGRTLMDLGKEVTFDGLKNRRIAIDASILLYESLMTGMQVEMTDKAGNITSHIIINFNRIRNFAKYRINTIWVFDNPTPPKLKAATLASRKEKIEAMVKDGKIRTKMLNVYIEQLKQLLTLMGITYIIAPEETDAEQYAAMLTMPNLKGGRLCDYVLSTDSDCLLYGGNLLALKRVADKGTKKKKQKLFIFDTKTVFDAISRDDLIKAGVVLGCDFAPKTPRIGAKTVIKKLDDIELTEEQKNATLLFKAQPPKYFAKDFIVPKYSPTLLLEFMKSIGSDEASMTEKIADFTASLI